LLCRAGDADKLSGNRTGRHRNGHDPAGTDQLPALDRRAPAPAGTAGRQQVRLRRRLHRHGGRRPQRAHRLPLRRGPGVLPPDRRRDGAQADAARGAAGRADPRRRDLLPAAAHPALAAANGRIGRPG